MALTERVQHAYEKALRDYGHRPEVTGVVIDPERAPGKVRITFEKN